MEQNYSVPIMPPMKSPEGSVPRKQEFAEREPDSVCIKGQTGGGGSRQYLNADDLREHLDSRARRIEARLAKAKDLKKIVELSVIIEVIAAMREKASKLKPTKKKGDEHLFDFDVEYQKIYDQLAANLTGFRNTEHAAESAGRVLARKHAEELVADAARKQADNLKGGD